jgi:hypothetical protein
MVARAARRWTEVTRCHGRGAQVADTVQRLVQRVHHACLGQHIVGTTGALDGLFTLQHIRPAGSDQHQVVKAHGLHGAGRGPDVTGVTGLYEDEACVHENQAKQADLKSNR